MDSEKNANNPSHYILAGVGVAITLLGVYLPYFIDTPTLSIVGWGIKFVGAIVCIRAVFKILGPQQAV